jgi:hypothetical protein
MTKALKKTLTIGALVLLTSCGNYISNSEVEDDPNRATTASADLLFNSVQVAGFAVQEGALSQTSAIWMQQLAGVDRQHLALGNYVTTEADYAFYMNAIYWGGGLIDIRKIITKSEENGNREYAGIAKVWEALNVGTAASIWGDIPYSETVNDVTTPGLDEQAAVYNALQALLDRAIADLESGAGGYIPPNDVVFNGAISKWIAAAHSLKARLYLHWAEVNPTNYSVALTEALMGINSPDGNFNSFHTQAESESSLRYQFQRTRDTYQRAGRYSIEKLKARNDPRLEIYFGLDKAGGYSGADPGEKLIDASNLSLAFLDKDASAEILTWSETRLIIAECRYKTGDETGALEELNNVRRGLESKLGMATESLGVASGLSGEFLIDAILEEKYFALFLNIEVWNDWKRTNRPVLPQADRIPHRLLYGDTERSSNPNIPAPSAQPLRNDNDPGDTY